MVYIVVFQSEHRLCLIILPSVNMNSGTNKGLYPQNIVKLMPQLLMRHNYEVAH